MRPAGLHAVPSTAEARAHWLRRCPTSLLNWSREGERHRDALTSARLRRSRATPDIPIVFIAGDAVGARLVASLARAGRNLTGLSVLRWSARQMRRVAA
jgi:hypothetical protein